MNYNCICPQAVMGACTLRDNGEAPCDMEETYRKENEKLDITQAARGESLNHSIKRENALRKELAEVKAELDLYKEAYTMACSRVKLYSQKHDRDWEAYHLRAASAALDASKCECKSGRRGPNCHDYHEGGQRMSKKADIKKVLIELSNKSFGNGIDSCEYVAGYPENETFITPYLERIMKIVEASDE